MTSWEMLFTTAAMDASRVVVLSVVTAVVDDSDFGGMLRTDQ